MMFRLGKLRLWLLALRQRWSLPQQQHPICTMDPEEFSNLLRSGHKKDLETLARKLSERRRSRV
jgi:hypothetical protein